jgi:hypothetical protein
LGRSVFVACSKCRSLNILDDFVAFVSRASIALVARLVPSLMISFVALFPNFGGKRPWAFAVDHSDRKQSNNPTANVKDLSISGSVRSPLPALRVQTISQHRRKRCDADHTMHSAAGGHQSRDFAAMHSALIER